VIADSFVLFLQNEEVGKVVLVDHAVSLFFRAKSIIDLSQLLFKVILLLLQHVSHGLDLLFKSFSNLLGHNFIIFSFFHLAVTLRCFLLRGFGPHIRILHLLVEHVSLHNKTGSLFCQLLYLGSQLFYPICCRDVSFLPLYHLLLLSLKLFGQVFKPFLLVTLLFG